MFEVPFVRPICPVGRPTKKLAMRTVKALIRHMKLEHEDNTFLTILTQALAEVLVNFLCAIAHAYPIPNIWARAKSSPNMHEPARQTLKGSIHHEQVKITVALGVGVGPQSNMLWNSLSCVAHIVYVNCRTQFRANMYVL